MAIVNVALATEDDLSEAIGLRLLAELSTSVTPNLSLGKKGSGYLRSGIQKWRQLAHKQVVLIFTDLDRVECPVALREDWLGSANVPVNLMLRIAVREVESWVLADHQAFRKLIGQKGKLPPDPDSLSDPKQHLLATSETSAKNNQSRFAEGFGGSFKPGNWLQQLARSLGSFFLESDPSGGTLPQFEAYSRSSA